MAHLKINSKHYTKSCKKILRHTIKMTNFLRIFQFAYPFLANCEDHVDPHMITQNNHALINLTGHILDPIILGL